MDPIHAPAPPKQAFNKNRRISNLIRAQIDHLKHIENKLPEELRVAIPQHPITTENDAALYIAAMTGFLRSQPMLVTTSAATPIDRFRRKLSIYQEEGLSLAAAASDEEDTATSDSKDASAGKTSSPPEVGNPSQKGEK